MFYKENNKGKSKHQAGVNITNRQDVCEILGNSEASLSISRAVTGVDHDGHSISNFGADDTMVTQIAVVIQQP